MRIPLTLLLLSVLGLITSTEAFLPVQLNDIGATLSGFVGSIFHGFTSPNSPERFGEDAQKLGPQVAQGVPNEATKLYSEVASSTTDLKNTVEKVVEHAHQIPPNMQKAAEKKGVTVDPATDWVSREAESIYQDPKNDIKDPLPEDHSEGAKAWKSILQTIMDIIQAVSIYVLTQLGMPREKLEAHLFTAFKIDFKVVVLVIALIYTVVMLLSQAILNLLGFGRQGPVKGTPAAWAQRKLYPEAIPANNWFAKLQRSAMKPNDK